MWNTALSLAKSSMSRQGIKILVCLTLEFNRLLLTSITVVNLIVILSTIVIYVSRVVNINNLLVSTTLELYFTLVEPQM